MFNLKVNIVLKLSFQIFFKILTSTNSENIFICFSEIWRIHIKWRSLVTKLEPCTSNNNNRLCKCYEARASNFTDSCKILLTLRAFRQFFIAGFLHSSFVWSHLTQSVLNHLIRICKASNTIFWIKFKIDNSRNSSLDFCSSNFGPLSKKFFLSFLKCPSNDCRQ